MMRLFLLVAALACFVSGVWHAWHEEWARAAFWIGMACYNRIAASDES